MDKAFPFHTAVSAWLAALWHLLLWSGFVISFHPFLPQ